MAGKVIRVEGNVYLQQGRKLSELLDEFAMPVSPPKFWALNSFEMNIEYEYFLPTE